MPRRPQEIIAGPEHGTEPINYEPDAAYRAYIFYRDYRYREDKIPTLNDVREKFNERFRSGSRRCPWSRWSEWARIYKWEERYNFYHDELSERFVKFREAEIKKLAGADIDFLRNNLAAISKTSLITHAKLVALFHRKVSEMGEEAFSEMTPRQIADFHSKLASTSKNLADVAAIVMGIIPVGEEFDITEE